MKPVPIVYVPAYFEMDTIKNFINYGVLIGQFPKNAYVVPAGQAFDQILGSINGGKFTAVPA
jgi:hypothetical protein